jgi:6-phosphogluconate dehydrogenase
LSLKVGVLGAATGVALRARNVGVEPITFTTDKGERNRLVEHGIALVEATAEFFEILEHPRIHLLDLQPGETIDALIDTAYVTMEPGDVLVDLTGSYWADTVRRWRRMRHRAIYYLDVALPEASRPDLLVGGDPRALQLVMPLLERLARGGRVLRLGTAGAAHFALQLEEALGTAVSHARSELQQLGEAWPGEVDPELLLAVVAPRAGARAGWVLDDALRMEAAVPLLAQAVMLEQARRLDEHEPPELLPRVGGFVRHEDLD